MFSAPTGAKRLVLLKVYGRVVAGLLLGRGGEGEHVLCRVEFLLPVAVEGIAWLGKPACGHHLIEMLRGVVLLAHSLLPCRVVARQAVAHLDFILY